MIGCLHVEVLVRYIIYIMFCVERNVRVANKVSFVSYCGERIKTIVQRIKSIVKQVPVAVPYSFYVENARHEIADSV